MNQPTAGSSSHAWALEPIEGAAAAPTPMAPARFHPDTRSNGDRRSGRDRRETIRLQPDRRSGKDRRPRSGWDHGYSI